MSVSGIGGGAGNTLYQRMLKGTQSGADAAGGEYDRKKAAAKPSRQ